MKKLLRITVNGKVFDVEAELLDVPGTPAASKPAGAARAASSAPVTAPAPSEKTTTAPVAGDGDIASPLAGKVVSIDAPVGTAVKAGTKVITLEAMKMNTIISAPADGTVKAVHVAPGDSVEEGQLLMSLA